MALIDRKLSDWKQAVSSLDDRPKMTAAQLKAAFDANSNELKPALNGVIDDLTSQQGASYIGVTPIEQMDGEQVQQVLQNLTDLARTTERRVDDLSTESGAATIGAAPIAGVTGENVQQILQFLYTTMMQIETGDPNDVQYVKKELIAAPNGLATLDDAGKILDSQLKWAVANGLATLDSTGKIPSTQIPNLFLPLVGGAMQGILNMNNRKITNLAAPTASNDAVRKTDLDALKTALEGTQIVTGTYIAEGTTKPVTINLGFRPKAVLLDAQYEPPKQTYIAEGTNCAGFTNIILDGVTRPYSDGNSTISMQILSNGFYVFGGNYNYFFNRVDKKYGYIAFR